MLVNNQETQLIRYNNYQFGIKTFGKQAACFVCTNKGWNDDYFNVKKFIKIHLAACKKKAD